MLPGINVHNLCTIMWLYILSKQYQMYIEIRWSFSVLGARKSIFMSKKTMYFECFCKLHCIYFVAVKYRRPWALHWPCLWPLWCKHCWLWGGPSKYTAVVLDGKLYWILFYVYNCTYASKFPAYDWIKLKILTMACALENFDFIREWTFIWFDVDIHYL